MLILVSTFGIANVVDNLVSLGLTAIPSWIAVGFLYFLPMALILAEFASDTTEAGGGIYSYMERGLGPTLAFVGTWSYFVANLVYLQSVFTRLPIRASLVASGGDAFSDKAFLLPLIGVVICVGITYVSSRGVRMFSRFADPIGRGILLMVAALILVPLLFLVLGKHASATPFSLTAMTPKLNLEYFSTFSWLLFAVAGAEVAAPYVKQTRDPARDFPRAILLTTVAIGWLYVLSTIAVALLFPVDQLTKATGLFDLWLPWAELLGLPGQAVARGFMAFIVLGSITSFVIWMESPIRAMFAEVPKGTFPERLTRRDADGTHHGALWAQAAVVSVLILIPLFSIVTGMSGSEVFIGLLNDMAALSLIVPYVFLALAYIRARSGGMRAPFQMTRFTPLAIAVGILVVVVSIFGYLGAGLFALQADPIDWIYVAIVYGGPVLLIGLGLALRRVSLRVSRSYPV